MSQIVSEFVYFKVKRSVRPEDHNSEEGRALRQVFDVTKHQSGHSSSAWGRTVEDPDILVWVIDWTDARGATTAGKLEPFLAPNPQPPLALYTILQPAITGTDTLTANPMTELAALPFPSNMTVAETKALNTDMLNFRTAMTEGIAQEIAPQSWAMGHVDRPGTIEHKESPTGQAVIRLLVIGWTSLQAHKDARETDQFVRTIQPLQQRMLPPVPGLEMKHVSFQKI
ncbi:hypothetical protein N7448_005077 [Penicillium atrosanguineum]|uniref:ABM domain-containing protein n=1 Tax=Penicillium atrosanguineum TaxID=1132637 RepID=A0A9W9H4I9_9EURO|nr:cytochrome P450 [Penicillium atrosanguineum]KAJ5125763.1 hypothetical protein N7526_007940 [Penicillium atrosanguineum]KAJ5136523.1 hypothetical protein N7448_005077 [Penicillium atrosanguineum]KAJ5292854.1 cytochrome P450 [Penicillium atrosanguineum]KAJ5303108.1 hypothetical protein N7476_009907 [Penicillium atrosanguineum]